MNFFEWLTTKRKTLSHMSPAELRAQEMLIENDCNRMQSRMQKLGDDKQKVIERGAKEKTTELRRTFASQYDLLHTEQMMLARQLNIRSKEKLTVSRLRMLREAAGTRGALGGGLGLIRDGDLATIERLIESDKISTEMYQQRLDEILRIGHGADEEGAMISPAAEELLRVWNEMDSGLIKDSNSAYEEAERRVRERDRAES